MSTGPFVRVCYDSRRDWAFVVASCDDCEFGAPAGEAGGSGEGEVEASEGRGKRDHKGQSIGGDSYAEAFVCGKLATSDQECEFHAFCVQATRLGTLF